MPRSLKWLDGQLQWGEKTYESSFLAGGGPQICVPVFFVHVLSSFCKLSAVYSNAPIYSIMLNCLAQNFIF